MFLLRAAAFAASTKAVRSQGLPLRVLPLSRLPALSLFPGHRPAKAGQMVSAGEPMNVQAQLGQQDFGRPTIDPRNAI